MGELGPWSRVQTSLCSVCTHDLGQYSPIQTDLTRLIRAKYQQIVFLQEHLFTRMDFDTAYLSVKPRLSMKNVDLAIETG